MGRGSCLCRAGPVLESKLQEWFGATESPRVGPHREVAVRLQLLSPAGRPLAITQGASVTHPHTRVHVSAVLCGRLFVCRAFTC